jgi:hypothetical protein
MLLNPGGSIVGDGDQRCAVADQAYKAALDW